jgi:hypothetical protein
MKTNVVILGKWAITQSVTPIAPGRTRLHHSMYSNMNRAFSKFVFYGTVFQVCIPTDAHICLYPQPSFHRPLLPPVKPETKRCYGLVFEFTYALV